MVHVVEQACHVAIRIAYVHDLMYVYNNCGFNDDDDDDDGDITLI